MTAGPGRRPPPPFITTEFAGREWLTPRLARVTLEGEALGELRVSEPASSVRVLIPSGDDPARLEIPSWDGNRFVLPDGSRPVLRTLTPRRHDPENGRLMLDVVVHGDGAAAQWAAGAADASVAAVSGPARGYTIDTGARSLILGGDETSIAAISQILEALPSEVEVSVYLETPASARPPLPEHPRCQVHWVDPRREVPGEALVEHLGEVDVPEKSRLWAAGEAAAMQRLRRRLLDDRGIPRTQATIRGYWKHGRRGDDQATDS